MPDEVISAVIEQAEEIGKLEAETEHQAEVIEELESTVNSLENIAKHDDERLTRLVDRVNDLEREVEEWKTKAQPAPEPVAEESLTEEILEIPIPEVAEPAKEVAQRKNLWSWLF